MRIRQAIKGRYPKEPGTAEDSDYDKRAIALKYEPASYRAPQVVASGRGRVARAILEAAQAAGVPIVEDEELSARLEKVGLEAEIPPELYEAVAAVLAYVYTLDEEATNGAGSSGQET